MSNKKMDHPTEITMILYILLLLFVLYLLLPRGLRVHYFGAYPKRYAWSTSRIRSSASVASSNNRNRLTDIGNIGNMYSSPPPSSTIVGELSPISITTANPNHRHLSTQGLPVTRDISQEQQMTAPPISTTNNNDSHEIIISTTMQQLREPGILIIAHGSKGKPKTVRLQLTESAITWRTEMKSKKAPNAPPKMGKVHQVVLSHIMYVDVGKQTTALRRVENASVPDNVCFSLLTKEGSLDLEATSFRERDALVNCFSLVLDEVHVQQNWRDVYRNPSSDMPSSFDEFEEGRGSSAGANMQNAVASGVSS